MKAVFHYITADLTRSNTFSLRDSSRSLNCCDATPFSRRCSFPLEDAGTSVAAGLGSACILRAGRAVPARQTFVRQGRNLEVPCAGMSKVRDRGDGGSGPNDPLRVPEYCLDSPSRPSLRSTNWRHKRRRRPCALGSARFHIRRTNAFYRTTLRFGT